MKKKTPTYHELNIYGKKKKKGNSLYFPVKKPSNAQKVNTFTFCALKDFLDKDI